MNDGVLNFSVLLHWLHQLIEQLDDPRQPSNGTKFSLKDIVLGAFAVFFMQLILKQGEIDVLPLH